MKPHVDLFSRICACKVSPPPSPSLSLLASSVYDTFSLLLYSLSPSGVLHIVVREEHSLCFCSNWMRWAEPCQCPHPLLLGRVQEAGGSGESEEGGERKGAKENGELPLPGTLIRQRRRPLSQYSQYRQHQGGSVWHTGKVIMTVGVSLERTNHCFTWLNGDVQKRQSLGQEQSLSVALLSKREMKAKPWIHWSKMIHLYVCK